ncbi:MAG: RluA family pseudouridine synthase [Bdellovibrionales bacterium]|nr:RluA family pseudouridine synthase [Oligoflexia bacterium]
MKEFPLILFENADYLAVSKPAGWLSIPPREPKPEVPVLSHWMREQSSTQTAFVIHRLDRFTSGVMLFAKTEGAQKEGTRWFETRIVKKIYHFLASPLPSRPALQIKTAVDGKSALTLFEVIEKSGNAFYGKASPLTGRFHQIREHAKVAGFPLLGDKAYAGLISFQGHHATLAIPRVCLHAYSLETPLGKIVAPLAEDLATLWKEIKNA